MKKLISVLFVILIISCTSTGNIVSNNGDSVIPLDQAVEHGVLENGLEYFIRPNSKPENRIVLRLVVNAGSVLEDNDQLGLAHLIEHMAFNGTTNFEGHEIIDYLESTGMQFGADINAYTSFDETVYKINIPADDPLMLEKGLSILKEWAFEIAFKDEEVDKERGVVYEEWRVGRGADARMLDKYLPVLFSGSQYAERLPIGDMDIVKNSSYNTIKRFYRDWYRPELMSVIVVGEVDTNSIKNQIEELFGSYSNGNNPRPREEFYVPDNSKRMYSIVSDPEATVTTLELIYKNDSLFENSKYSYRINIIKILNNIMYEQRLNELTHQSVPPYIYAFAGGSSLVRTKSTFSMGAVTAEGGVVKAFNALLKENERFMRFGFTESEFERAQSDLLSYIESIYREKDKTESVLYVEELTKYFLEGTPSPGIEWELFEVKSIFSDLSLDEVIATGRTVRSESDPVVIVTGPEKDGVVYPGEDFFERGFERVVSEDLKAYDDGTKGFVLSNNLPLAGSIDSTSRDEVADFDIWELSNGSRVVFKNTDLKNDELLFSAFSPGGTSLSEDSDYLSATMASTLVTLSGLGDLGVVDLGKVLSGKMVSLSPYIGTLYEGFSGSSIPKDAETLFQLLNLYFTSVRRDDTAFKSLINRLGGLIENRESQPEIIFQDAINEAVYNDHFRSQPLTLSRLGEIDQGKAYDIFQERFSNPDDFIFFFAGNIPENFRYLVESYIASIPQSGVRENWIDRKLDLIQGVNSIDVHVGIEQKSSVNILFSGDYIWTLENNTALYALRDLLDLRLWEEVRENASGTYGVNVSASPIKSPAEMYTLSIGFACDPERVEELTAIVFKVIDEVRSSGVVIEDEVRSSEISVENVTKIKEGFRRAYEESVLENSYWLGLMDAVFRFNLDSSSLLNKPVRNDALSGEMIGDAALKYLDLDNYFKAVLYPQN
ncbi:MAG: insulinase family protein [Spirochaetia bacterium]|jgi:zinc protease|nr:insulinase family protein [Spirochaetia bacterium]